MSLFEKEGRATVKQVSASNSLKFTNMCHFPCALPFSVVHVEASNPPRFGTSDFCRFGTSLDTDFWMFGTSLDTDFWMFGTSLDTDFWMFGTSLDFCRQMIWSRGRALEKDNSTISRNKLDKISYGLWFSITYKNLKQFQEILASFSSWKTICKLHKAISKKELSYTIGLIKVK